MTLNTRNTMASSQRTMPNDFQTPAPLQPEQRLWLKQTSTVFVQCQQYQRALPLLNLLVHWYPNDTQVLTQLACVYYRTADYKTALSFCQRCLNEPTNKSDRQLYLLTSLCYLNMGQREQAQEYYQHFCHEGKDL